MTERHDCNNCDKTMKQICEGLVEMVIVAALREAKLPMTLPSIPNVLRQVAEKMEAMNSFLNGRRATYELVETFLTQWDEAQAAGVRETAERN